MHSHIYGSPNMIHSGITKLGRAGCLQVHTTHTFSMGNVVMKNVKPNSTTTGSATLAGHIGPIGQCKTVGQYIDDVGTLTDVVVQGALELTIQDYIATALIDEGKLLISRLAL